MSNYRVIVKKGEIYVRRWVSEMREYEIIKKEKQVLSDVLQFPIEIEETTFGQFFELIAREADLFERIFAASMYRHPLQPYIDEIRKDPDRALGDIWKVRVYWGVELFEGELTFWPGFDGYGSWGQPTETPQPDWPTEGGIAIEYTPLNNYKNIPFVLDKDVDIRELKPKAESLVKAAMDFTVYDVINAILYEITWSGDISQGRKGPDIPPLDEIQNLQ